MVQLSTADGDQRSAKDKDSAFQYFWKVAIHFFGNRRKTLPTIPSWKINAFSSFFFPFTSLPPGSISILHAIQAPCWLTKANRHLQRKVWTSNASILCLNTLLQSAADCCQLLRGSLAQVDVTSQAVCCCWMTQILLSYHSVWVRFCGRLFLPPGCRVYKLNLRRIKPILLKSPENLLRGSWMLERSFALGARCEGTSRHCMHHLAERHFFLEVGLPSCCCYSAVAQRAALSVRG